MKKQLLFAAMFVCSLVYMASCKKDKTTPPTPTSTLNNMHDFVQKYGVEKEQFTFNTSELPKTFTFSKGTKITIYPGTIMLNGYPVTGELTMEAIDVRKRSDAIFTGANTNRTSGSPLVSDGFFFMDIKSNGTSVDQMLNGSYMVEMPTTRNGEFTSVWLGDENMDDSGQLGWENRLDSVKGLNSFFGFTLADLGWVNCDVDFSPNSPKTTITVQLQNNPGQLADFLGEHGSTYVLFCPQGVNVVHQLYTPAGTDAVKSYDNSTPIGVTGKLMAFCIKEGKLWFAEQEVTITANMQSTLSLTETTEANIQSKIQSLDTY